MRVMVVDDSLTVRTILSRLIEKEPDLEVVAKAGSAESALSQLARQPADVVLLDLEMPGMGGLAALPKILSLTTNTQVLVVSSLTDDGAEHTLRALSIGAADTLLKPRPGEFGEDYQHTLLRKIRALGTAARPASTSPSDEGPAAIDPPERLQEPPRAIAFGASTGGIHALNLIFSRLPRSCRIPILITQHLPSSFIPVFARQLETISSRKTLIADQGTELVPGRILVAPGDGHLRVRLSHGRPVTEIVQFPAPSGCLPSVDPMFESLAESLDGRVLGVVLSGMGRDGVLGAERIVEKGGMIIAQDAQSSAVWGMPKAVADAGLASEVLDPAAIADRIAEFAGDTVCR